MNNEIAKLKIDCREQSDPMKSAMRMLLIAFATDHFDALMERLDVGRVGA